MKTDECCIMKSCFWEPKWKSKNWQQKTNRDTNRTDGLMAQSTECWPGGLACIRVPYWTTDLHC